MRIAVVGLPRGGTSALVGMLRILGFGLPEGSECPSCEHEELRAPMSTKEAKRIVKRLKGLPDGIVWKDPSAGSYADLIPWDMFTVVRIHRIESHTVEAERRRVPQGHPDATERNRKWSASIGEHVVPDLDVSFELMKVAPLYVGNMITQELGLPDMDPGQREAISKFIRRAPGYRCPLPGTCQASH